MALGSLLLSAVLLSAAQPVATAPPAAGAVDPCSLPLPLPITDADCQRLAAGEVVVQLREVSDSAVREGVALAVVQAPAEAVFQVVADAERFDEFLPNVAESTVEIDAEGRILNHQRLDVPLLPDRHYTVRIVNQRTEDGAGPLWRSSWSYLPGSGNIESSEGSWTVRPLAEERSLLIYQVLTDPGGWLPAWTIDLATRSTLPEVMAAVRRRVDQQRGG